MTGSIFDFFRRDPVLRGRPCCRADACLQHASAARLCIRRHPQAAPATRPTTRCVLCRRVHPARTYFTTAARPHVRNLNKSKEFELSIDLNYKFFKQGSSEIESVYKAHPELRDDPVHHPDPCQRQRAGGEDLGLARLGREPRLAGRVQREQRLRWLAAASESRTVSRRLTWALRTWRSRAACLRRPSRVPWSR